MGERPDRDQIDARSATSPTVARVTPPEASRRRGHNLDRAAHGLQVHVVEHDDVGPGLQGLPEFIQVGDLDFDAQRMGSVRAGQGDGPRYPVCWSARRRPPGGCP